MRKSKIKNRCFITFVPATTLHNSDNPLTKNLKTNQSLSAAVFPDRTVLLEWTDTRQYLSNTRRQLEKDIFAAYSSGSTGEWLVFAGFCDRSIPLSASLDFFRKIGGEFADAICGHPEIEQYRDSVEIPPNSASLAMHLENLPPMPGAEYIDISLLNDWWRLTGEAFSRSLESWDGTVRSWIQSIRPDAHLVGRVYFHLVENSKTIGPQDPFAFLATYSNGMDASGKPRHLPLKHALQTYQHNEDELFALLATVYRAAEKSALISELVETGDLFHPLFWSSAKAFIFLKEIPEYEAAGILCRIPDWWKKKHATVRLGLNVGKTEPSFVGLDSLVSFHPKLMIGEEEISIAEARRLLEEAESLTFIKNKWVAVDPARLELTLGAYEKAMKMADTGSFTLKEALALQMHPEKAFGMGVETEGDLVSSGDWLQSAIGKLGLSISRKRVKPSFRFTAKLRPYQQEGLNWLHFHHQLGFGACLADDMGLGKTIELLSLLDVLQPNGRKHRNEVSGNSVADLLIVPASLVSNWASEIDRFCPHIQYFAAHPSMQEKNRLLAMEGVDIDRNHDLVITTYSLIQRYEWMKNHSWRYVILDEAQAIKNPSTRQTRAVKALSARNRIILTGTPIENRLSDLWSLFDFLNPGLLGSATEFKDYMKQLDKGEKDHAGLRRLVRPFILRRLKTDKSIISDLPEKVEMKAFAPLSKRQRLLYQKLVDDLAHAIENSEGIQRKGLVLSSLMKFKQLCNHPDQYLGSGEFREADSGKFTRLREICETIRDKRESVLVFTQFKEVVDPLAKFLAQVFDRPGLFIHGSVPVGERKKRVEQFQADNYTPFMILTLKAGGVGLNLTRASHVIHFDRWWNPAVENQATDRAFRIGQKNNVMVHKLLTQGTVEEKIDRMLSSKQTLAEEIIGDTGEAWITAMDNDELIETFRLGLNPSFKKE